MDTVRGQLLRFCAVVGLLTEPPICDRAEYNL
jgi:hypothetical protein